MEFSILGSYSQQGIQKINESPDRLDLAREMANMYGVEIVSFFLTMGAFDMIIHVRALSSEAMMKFTLALSSLGNIRTTTLTAFDENTYREILSGFP